VQQINTLVSQINTVATDVNTNSDTATTKADAAANSATAAQNSANAAASIANVWVSGSSYTLGTIVYSPVNFQTYRAKTTHSGITTDPSSDATRWAVLGATINNTLTSTSTTDALSAAQGKALQDGKQATLVSGTNIKTVNGTSVLGSGDITISSGVKLATPSANQWVGLTIYTSTTNITVPTGATVMRAYAWGKGGDSTGNPGNGYYYGGGGGGCAYGEVSVTAGQTVNLAISSGAATVAISGTTYITANPANLTTGGTASKHASVTNGGAYSGGNGSGSSNYTGGASSGSMFGNGRANYTGANSGGGSSWLYQSGGTNYPASLAGSGGGIGAYDGGLPPNSIVTDPFLMAMGVYYGSSTSSGVDASQLPIGCGGFSSVKGGFGGGGGYYSNGGLGGGGAGSSTASTSGQFTGGAACIVVCWR
jgi:hypothetical protein